MRRELSFPADVAGTQQPLRTGALVMGALSATLGLIVLAGWLSGNSSITGALGFGVPMSANAALALCLCGIGLCILASRSHPLSDIALRSISLIVMLLGGLPLAQDLFQIDLWVDQLLAVEPTLGPSAISPGRLAPPTAFAFLLSGAALATAGWRTPHGLRMPILTAIASSLILIAGVALAGHAAQDVTGLRLLNYTRIAPTAAVGVLILGCGFLLLPARDERRPWALDKVATSGFVLGLIAMISVAAISYQFTSRLADDAAQVARSEELLKNIRALDADLDEFTISAGRYIITSDARTLGNREAVKQAIQKGLAALRSAVATQPMQLARLQRIAAAHDERIVLSDEIIAATSARIAAGLPLPAGASPLGQRYPKLGTEIERLVQEIEATEARRLDRLTAESVATSNRTFLLLPLGVLVSLTLLMVGLFLLNAAAVERRAVEVRLERKRRRLELVHEIDRAIIAAQTPRQIAEAALERLRPLLDVPRASVSVFDLAEGNAEWLAAAGDQNAAIKAGTRYPLAVLGDLGLLKEGTPKHIDVDDRFQDETRDAFLAAGIDSFVVIPMFAEQQLIGSLNFGTPRHQFSAEQIEIASEVSAQIAIALNQAMLDDRARRANAQLDYLAYYDKLTGLPNRRLFHDRLFHSLRPRSGDATLISVVLLDIERFRRVNETLGRDAGDELLCEVAKRLGRVNDSVARIGIDQFALIARGTRGPAEVNRMVEGLSTACFRDPVLIGGKEIRVSCRAGVALFPTDGAEADALVRNAEAALRMSKTSGDRVVFYAQEMNARVADTLLLENKLRLALERNEFELHYQPKVILSSGRIAGAEALLRWRDPERGLIPPGHFIPLLEETGMIVDVGRWALARAYADCAGWRKNGLRAPRIAVNVSPVQLQRAEFVNEVIEEIERGGGDGEWIELEITESLVMRNVEDSTRKLSILRGMGVSVAIDDFGTGYSSLSYLGRLPVDLLKIDRSFIMQLEAAAEARTLVSSVVALAHSLKLKVIAEGVETETQASMLRAFNCDQGQGYLYSKPLPMAEFEALIRSNARFPAAPLRRQEN